MRERGRLEEREKRTIGGREEGKIGGIGEVRSKWGRE